MRRTVLRVTSLLHGLSLNSARLIKKIYKLCACSSLAHKKTDDNG